MDPNHSDFDDASMNSLVPMDEMLPGMADDEPSMDMEAEARMEDLQHRVAMMIADARDFNDTTLAPAREKADLYYMGSEPALEEEGRSSIVSMEVKDVIMGMMPSLMRIFTASEPVCNFIATNEANVPAARQATDFVNYKLMNSCDGYRLLFSAITDALRKATGVVQWYTDFTEEYTVRDYSGVTEMQVRYFLSQTPGAEVVKAIPADVPGTIHVRIRIRVSTPKLMAESVPPEELRIDRMAASAATSRLIGRERSMRRSDLLELGYTSDIVDQYSGSGDRSVWSLERQFRNPGAMEGAEDYDTNFINYGEYYILVDTDGDGIDELNYVCVMGDNDHIVKIEPASRRKIALFCPDLEPHAVIGHSIAEYCYDLQRIKTNLMRNTLDSLAQTIYPRQVVNENVVNIDDILNTELGAPIRTKGDVQAAVAQLQTRFDGDQILPIISYLDNVRQFRTGVSEASKGVDPRALQSTTVKGVDMLITGAQERTELVARTLAETGLKELFAGLLAEMCDHPNPAEIMYVRGAYVPVNPSQFDPSLPVQVNPNIGKGTDADRMMMLTQVKSTQEMIISQMGPENPLVTPVEYRNTLEDLLAIANIKDVSRYFKPITPQDVQAALQQKHQAAMNQPNPALILANTEAEKVRATTAKAVADNNFRNKKLALDDNFRHLQLQGTMEQALLSALAQHQVQPQHDMAKSILAAAKDLIIAQHSGDTGEGSDGGDASEPSDGQ